MIFVSRVRRGARLFCRGDPVASERARDGRERGEGVSRCNSELLRAYHGDAREKPDLVFFFSSPLPSLIPSPRLLSESLSLVFLSPVFNSPPRSRVSFSLASDRSFNLEVSHLPRSRDLYPHRPAPDMTIDMRKHTCFKLSSTAWLSREYLFMRFFFPVIKNIPYNKNGNPTLLTVRDERFFVTRSWSAVANDRSMRTFDLIPLSPGKQKIDHFFFLFHRKSMEPPWGPVFG